MPLNRRKRENVRSGFSLLEMMIVVAVVAILASTTFLSVVRAREQTQKQNIINNLKKIEAAKSQWAMEKGKSTGATPGKTDLAPYFDKDTFPTGVSNETYHIEPIGTLPYADVAQPISSVTRFAGIN